MAPRATDGLLPIPHDVSRRARAFLLAALLHADAAGEIDVDAAQATLGVDRSNRNRALKELVARGLVRRGHCIRDPAGEWYAPCFLLYSRFFRADPGMCHRCGRPVGVAQSRPRLKVRSELSVVVDRTCARCRQAFREDRLWVDTAVQMLLDGHGPLGIATALERPLRTIPGEPGAERGSNAGRRLGTVGVVDALVAKGALDPKYLKVGTDAFDPDEP